MEGRRGGGGREREGEGGEEVGTGGGRKEGGEGWREISLYVFYRGRGMEEGVLPGAILCRLSVTHMYLAALLLPKVHYWAGLTCHCYVLAYI